MLYTRIGCHLCDEAEALLAEFGLQPLKVDIDTDQQLVDRFGACVPVVEFEGRVRFRGRVDRLLLRRLLATPPANSAPISGEARDA